MVLATLRCRRAAEPIRMTTLIAAIKQLCQRYAHPGVEPGTHAFAMKVLRMIEEWEETQNG